MENVIPIVILKISCLANLVGFFVFLGITCLMIKLKFLDINITFQVNNKNPLITFKLSNQLEVNTFFFLICRINKKRINLPSFFALLPTDCQTVFFVLGSVSEKFIETVGFSLTQTLEWLIGFFVSMGTKGVCKVNFLR
jgi:hypothetical protein